MNLQRREEIRAIAECPNDMHWAQEMRRAVAELLAHIDTLEQTATERVIGDGSRGPGVAPAAVVPDDDRPSREFLENYVEGFDPGERSAALFGWREGRRHLREHSHAIPAGGVLGEGMVAVDRNALLSLFYVDDNGGPRFPTPREKSVLDSIRANQGEAAAKRVITDGSGRPKPCHAGEGSAWVPPVEARAVVVPELTDTETIEVHGFAIRNGCGSNSCYVRKSGVGTNGPCTCIPRFVGVGTRIKLISALRANQGGGRA